MHEDEPKIEKLLEAMECQIMQVSLEKSTGHDEYDLQ